MALDYDYYCELNDKVLSVRHGMTEQLSTWGELCERLGISDTSAPSDTPIRRLLSGGTLAIPRRVSKDAPRTDLDTMLCGSDSCQPCPCANPTRGETSR